MKTLVEKEKIKTIPLTKITVYYACFNGDDGSVYLKWYLNGKSASESEESQDEGWGEDCTGHVETFIGSDIHKKAVKSQSEFDNDPDRKKAKEMESITDSKDILKWITNHFKNTDKDSLNDAKYDLKQIINKMDDHDKYEWNNVLTNYTK